MRRLACVKRRRLGLVVGVCAVLTVIVVLVVVVFALSEGDPNHKTAVRVVQDAGVPAKPWHSAVQGAGGMGARGGPSIRGL